MSEERPVRTAIFLTYAVRKTKKLTLDNVRLRSRAYFAGRSFSMLVVASVLLGQQTPEPQVLAPHKPFAPKVTRRHPFAPGSPGSMIGGPWIVDGNFKSSVYIKNSVQTDSIKVTPVLYLSNGVFYTLPEITLGPSATSILDIGKSLENLGLSPYAPLTGSIELKYNWPWDPLCATIRNLDATHSLIFSYGLHSSTAPLMPGMTAPPTSSMARVIEGVWWKQEPNVTGFVALTNTTLRAISATLALSDDAGSSFGEQTVKISPHGTKTVTLPELATAKSSSGGLRVVYTGSLTDLLVNGGLQDASVGYSAKIPFTTAPPLETQTTWKVAELGLMTGPADPMMHFPSGTTFTPYTVIRNVSSAPAQTTPTLWWMAGGTSHSFLLPAIGLAPGQTRSIDFSTMLAQAGLSTFSGNVQVAFKVEGNAGGLLIGAGSVDKSNTYVFEVSPHGVTESASKSLSYWDTANGDDTMVTVWNPADEAQDYVFQVTYAGGHYGYPIHLEARGARSFNMSEIIQSGIPDADGNVIPGSVQEGAAGISGVHADNEHILVVMDAGTYNVRKATCIVYCQGCDGVTGFAVTDNPFTVATRYQYQLAAHETWNTGSQYDDTSSSNWSSSANSKATVGTPGNGTAGRVSGVSPGSAAISAVSSYYGPQYTSYWCEGSQWSCPYQEYAPQGGSPGTVASLSITSVAPSSLTLCASGVLTITGSGYQSFPGTPTVSSSGGVSLSTANVINDSTLTVPYSVGCGAPVGSQSIVVAFPGADGGSGAQSNPGYVSVSCPSLSISVTRSNLTTTSATGSPASVAATPAFTYAASGSGAIAAYATSNANANPNTATISGQTNPGSPEAGGLGTLTATYACTGGNQTSKSFSVPTFGLSCYVLALESDWGTPPNSCSSNYIPIYGETYSGTSVNPSGMPAGTYCNAFLGQLRLQGSGSTRTGTKVHYVSGDTPTWTFAVITQFTGADGTALVVNGSVARDRAVVPRNTTVQLPSGNYVANDTGGGINGYRLDVFMGAGKAACNGFANNVVVGACSPGTNACPSQTIQ